MNDSRHDNVADVWRPDVTVAAIVPRDGRYLLVEEIVRGERVLNQPAGHLEADEALTTACRRETLEETGWEVELEALVGIYQWTAPDSGLGFLRFTFLASAQRHRPERLLDQGIVQALWLSHEQIAAEAARLRSPMILRSIEDYLAGRRYPLHLLHAPLPGALPAPI